MKTLSLSELIAALQNAQKEGIETVCVYSSKMDCGFNINKIRAITSDNSAVVLFLDPTKEIDLGSEIEIGEME